ncbi:migration and invasion-inhibitory protein [Elgaria multicarinata webbii]|uniref:migration and invasion-inhibitory protein n=1 Tax=Elgaria multicarinata webbii TaxID=159646 RepID=UPI002FCD1136
MDLEKLRHMNQELLRKLKANQEEFKSRVQIKLTSQPPRSEKAIPESRWLSDPKRGEVTQDRFPKAVTDAAMPGSVEEGLWNGCLGFDSSTESRHQCEVYHQEYLQPSIPKEEVIIEPSLEAAKLAGGSYKMVNSGRGPRARSASTIRAEAKQHRGLGLNVSEREGPRTGEEPDEMWAAESGRPTVSARMPPTPKSILLTPQNKQKTKKEAGHVTFMSDPEEYTIPAGGWSIRPFLGYDWIAGLLDMDSSVSEKPEEYFSELQDFRRVNKDACISDGDLGLEGLGASLGDRESDADAASHRCVFCYRLNKRLFATPLDPESACPVCKTPRVRRPPETLVEPAFVRVSIPRSTLLPAYKHKIHRRKSYEPADNLALPSHCLAGWENPLPASGPTLSSLDLRASVEPAPAVRPGQNFGSRVSGGSKTDRLLDLSRGAGFELGTLAWQRSGSKLPCSGAALK